MIHIAEDVLPGHPDRLADAIAEKLVDRAVEIDPNALAAVEVAINLHWVYITGRIATSTSLELDIPTLVSQTYREAGYQGRWQLVPIVDTNALQITSLPVEESAIRGYADDQNVVTGYACNSPSTGFIPPAVFLARNIRFSLSDLIRQFPGFFGPDGKILVHLERKDGKLTWKRCNIVIQHAPDIGYDVFFNLIAPRIAQLGTAEWWDVSRLRINGGGDFIVGGPQADNGLTGKKLVVDHYGPSIPIGGGAMCGKDPHKIDRLGPLRARQVALSIVQETGAEEALVTLGYLPGQRKPDFICARVDGELWSEDDIYNAVHVPDLSIDGTFFQLNLDQVRWHDVLHKGYFGNQWSWEST